MGIQFERDFVTNSELLFKYVRGKLGLYVGALRKLRPGRRGSLECIRDAQQLLCSHHRGIAQFWTGLNCDSSDLRRNYVQDI